MNALQSLGWELMAPQGELVCVGGALLLTLIGCLSLVGVLPCLRHDLPHTLARIRQGEAPPGAWRHDIAPLILHLGLIIVVVGLWLWAPWPSQWNKASHFALFGFALAHALMAWEGMGEKGEWLGRNAYLERHSQEKQLMAHEAPETHAKKASPKTKKKGKKGRR